MVVYLQRTSEKCVQLTTVSQDWSCRVRTRRVSMARLTSAALSGVSDIVAGCTVIWVIAGVNRPRVPAVPNHPPEIPFELFHALLRDKLQDCRRPQNRDIVTEK